MLSELNWRPAASAKTIRSKPNADSDTLVDQADRLERPQRRPGQADADAQHVPFRLQLDDVDPDIAAAERNGEREARDAAADDQNLLMLPTAASTPASALPP